LPAGFHWYCRWARLHYAGHILLLSPILRCQPLNFIIDYYRLFHLIADIFRYIFIIDDFHAISFFISFIISFHYWQPAFSLATHIILILIHFDIAFIALPTLATPISCRRYCHAILADTPLMPLTLLAIFASWYYYAIDAAIEHWWYFIFIIIIDIDDIID